jgi:hypothetical protein
MSETLLPDHPLSTFPQADYPDDMSVSWCDALDSIMVLVPFLFPGSPLGVIPIRHVTKGAYKDHEDKEQEHKLLHTALLCCCISDTLLAQDSYDMARGI